MFAKPEHRISTNSTKRRFLTFEPTRESLIQPIQHCLPKRQKRRRVSNQHRRRRNLSIHSPALTQRPKPPHRALIRRSSTLSRLLLSNSIHDIQVHAIRQRLKRIDTPLRRRPSLVCVVRFEAVHVVDGAVQTVWHPERFV